MSGSQVKIGELMADYPRCGPKYVKDWHKEVISGAEDWGFFLYWNPWTDGDGFEAMFVQCMSRVSTDPVDETHVEVVFHISAFYDGARHMYFNIYDKDPECKGYIYYPDIPSMIKALQFVEDLQKKHCAHYDD